MKPYFEQDGIQLFLGDCRDVLPRLAPESVDLIVTDPPYGVGWESSFRRLPFGPMANDDGSFDIIGALRLAIGPGADGPLKRKRHVYVFGLRDWGDLPIGGRCELIWDKATLGMGDTESVWAPQHEVIAFGVMIPTRYDREAGRGLLSARLRRGSVLRVPRETTTAAIRHPTEKPVGLLRQLIESSSMLGETVLDPFVGSGSTLVAARIEGRRAIGIEISERYAEVAARRLAQRSLFAAEGAG